MKIEKSKDWTHKLIVKDIPKNHPDDLDELEIVISYASKNACGDARKAVPLDNIVIPAIIRAFNISCLNI